MSPQEPGLLLVAIFLLVVVIMLLNTLIAMMADTFTAVTSAAFANYAYAFAKTLVLMRVSTGVAVPLNLLAIPFDSLRFLYRIPQTVGCVRTLYDAYHANTAPPGKKLQHQRSHSAVQVGKIALKEHWTCQGKLLRRGEDDAHRSNASSDAIGRQSGLAHPTLLAASGGIGRHVARPALIREATQNVSNLIVDLSQFSADANEETGYFFQGGDGSGRDPEVIKRIDDVRLLILRDGAKKLHFERMIARFCSIQVGRQLLYFPPPPRRRAPFAMRAPCPLAPICSFLLSCAHSDCARRFDRSAPRLGRE